MPQHSIPDAEMIGSATVRLHFPTQEKSYIVAILFILLSSM